MLLTHFCEKELSYDGSQLRPLFNYLKFDLMGSSAVAFKGACSIPFENMADGEDLKEQSPIFSASMLHFIFEVFDRELLSGVLLQRIFASLIQDDIYKKTKTMLERRGDDLYLGPKKLSISIATPSVNSILVHFAVNITTEGTPVPTLGLQDLGLDPASCARDWLKLVKNEFESCEQATWKVFGK